MIRLVAGEEFPGPAHSGRDAAALARWSHRHRDVSGGWLRPTVFGAVDGLVTNASLIAGVGGGGVSAHTVVLTGVAALVAGAFSMGTGEYVSVTNQNELVHAEVDLERRMLARFPAIEQDELAGYFRGYGADAETAGRMAAAVSKNPDMALLVHTKEELGVDPRELPSALPDQDRVRRLTSWIRPRRNGTPRPCRCRTRATGAGRARRCRRPRGRGAPDRRSASARLTAPRRAGR